MMNNPQSVPIVQNIQESVDSLSGLTINDLNKYLPALLTVEDLSLEVDHLKEGVFWSEGLKGLQKLPSGSIDLIVTEPPKEPWMNLETRGSQFTLQEYYSWNQKWIIEASRVLKNTGGIDLLLSLIHI